MDKRGPRVHLFSTMAQLRNIAVHMWTLASSLEGLFIQHKWEEHPGVLVVLRTQSLHRGQMAPTPSPVPLVLRFLSSQSQKGLSSYPLLSESWGHTHCERTKPVSAHIILGFFSKREPSFEDLVMPSCTLSLTEPMLGLRELS